LFETRLARAQASNQQDAIAEANEKLARLPLVSAHDFAALDNIAVASFIPLLCPDYPVTKWLTFRRGIVLSSALLPQIAAADLNHRSAVFQVPVFIIQGERDAVKTVQRYFERINSPAKQLLIYDGGDHVVVTSDRFLRDLQLIESELHGAAGRSGQ